MAAARILLVEPEKPAAEAVAKHLQSLGHTTCAVVASGHQAVEKAAALPLDLALVALDLAGAVDGPEVADQLRQRFDVPVIYLTDGAAGELMQRARATGPFGYVLKPVDARQLRLSIETALGMREKEKKCRAAENKLKETIDELREQNDLIRTMQTIFDSMSEGIVAVDENGSRLVFNASAERLLGRFRSETNQNPAQWTKTYGVYFPDQVTPIPTDQLALVRAMRGEALNDWEIFIRNENQAEGVSVSSSGRPLLSDTGEPKGGMIVLRDLTRQKEADNRLKETVDELQRQTQLFQAIFNSMSDGVVVADENGRFTLFNPSAEHIAGKGMLPIAPDQWTADYGIFYPDKVTPVPIAHLPLARALRGEETDEMELFVRNPVKPEGVHVSASGRPIRQLDVPRGGVVVFRDITERARAEEALAQAFAQGRLEVLDTVLHNIGNAINSVTVGIGTLHEQLTQERLIQRFSALAEAVEAHSDDWFAYLQHDPQGQQVRPFLVALANDFAKQNQRLIRTVERVRGRVGHIVDIIRTQRGVNNVNMARKDVDLRQAIASALRILQPLANKGIRAHVNCGNAPKEIYVQESQFHQMLVNLLKNAVEAIEALRQTGDSRACRALKSEPTRPRNFSFST